MKGDRFLRQVAMQAPFSQMHPAWLSFFSDYLSHEKVVRFGDRYVINTHLPPYPSGAFDNLVEHFNQIGRTDTRRLFSVTLAVTNRCSYRCWHCYNAGRRQTDVPLDRLQDVIRQLQALHVIMVTLSGGEPLLRRDLESIIACFDQRTSLCLNTTGWGLTPQRAGQLKKAGLFAIGISLDAIDAHTHDRYRGREGAFAAAVQALAMGVDAGLYPYVIALATREFLEPRHFHAYVQFISQAGAREIHLLEPCAVGNLAGQSDVLLTAQERRQILDYQKTYAADDHAPIISSFLYLESEDAFGCGAGLTHLYIDGCGDVSPCNLVPLSFGNVMEQPLEVILNNMGVYFQQPRTECIGRTLNPYITATTLPADPKTSAAICEAHLPKDHAVPRFFQVRRAATARVGPAELKAAYNQVSGDYDDFWLHYAGAPIESLVQQLPWRGDERVFEAGCGTGYATVRIAGKLHSPAQIIAVDLSEGMLSGARRRAAVHGLAGIRFMAGDALECLKSAGPFEVVFSSWVLGYIPLQPFFKAAARALTSEGRLAFVVHRLHSPQRELEIFSRMVVENPQVLTRQVDFDFPRDTRHVKAALTYAGLACDRITEGQVTFPYNNEEQVLEHLLKSGAGTAYYEAVDPRARPGLEAEFKTRLKEEARNDFRVVHEYIACIARLPET